MTRGFIFWIIMLILLIVGVLWHFGTLGMFGPIGFGGIAYILFGLLGWQVFGPPVRG
jgi:hypothetical protein